MAAACSAGAYSTTKDKEISEKMWHFGEKVGIAYQIRDDLFDFGVDDVGKPLGIDIKEKKMTLPLIYALSKASTSIRRKIIKGIKRHSDRPETVQEIIQFVRQSGGLEYATKAMHEYRQAAFDLLHTFPQSPARDAMEQLVTFVTDRKK